MKKFFYVIMVLVVAAVTTYKVYTSSQKQILSALALANIEALASDEFCKSCLPCTGEYNVCGSELDDFFEDMMSNCSSFDGLLNIEIC